VSVVGTIFVNIIVERYKAALARTKDEGMAALAAANAEKLERLRSDLERLTDENRMRFSALYLRRAEVILNLHKRLLESQRSWTTLLSPARSLQAQEEEQAAHRAYEAKDQFRKDYYESRIYFPTNVCERLDAIDAEYDRINTAYSLQAQRPSPESHAAAWEAFQHLNGDLNHMRLELEAEFRVMLGAAESPVVPAGAPRDITNPSRL
jgi:hypothetical protein